MTIPISSRPGVRLLTITCGRQRRSARFTIVSPPPPSASSQPASANPLQPDDQGFIFGDFGNQEDGGTDGQLGGGDYPNARIADIGLSKVGQNLFTPGRIDHGQCKQAVNDWVAEASGHTQILGGDYYGNYAREGGTQVGRDQAVKGDIIQLDNPADTRNYYRGMHTAVVVSHTPGSNVFDVVDSNSKWDDVVRHHLWDPYASAARYGRRMTIWRMGSTNAPLPDPTPPTPGPAPQPAPTPPSVPPPPPTHSETTGPGPVHTWTNYTNAGGTEGPTIPANSTVQIACKITGFRVADGNTWWYRIAQAPWSGTFYASADAFYNNGQTSGSLHGTPFVDPAVPNC